MLIAVLLAAQITNVADAADEKHPLELDLEAGFSHLRSDTRIAREQPGGWLNDELNHTRTLDAVELRLAVGLWHDLELHAYAPFALQDVQTWQPAGTTSSLSTNTIDISGCAAAGSCTAAQPILPVNGRSERRGFFDPTFGIAWAPINEEREMQLRPDLFPPGHAYSTWALGVDYTAPLGTRIDDPNRFGFNSASGAPSPGAGSEFRKAHVITGWTAFSKRFRVLEPYFRIFGSAPFAAPGAYDNCSHPEKLADVAAVNCAGPWARQTGYRPPFEGGATFGAELVASEDTIEDRRFAFDVRGGLTWHGPSRGYTQVTDALGKLTSSDEYVTSTAQAGFYGRLARWFHFRLYGMAGMDSAHFVTHEEVGRDKDGDGKITLSAGSGIAAPDQNPTYDFRVDAVGHRLRAEPALFWGVGGTLSLNF